MNPFSAPPEISWNAIWLWTGKITCLGHRYVSRHDESRGLVWACVFGLHLLMLLWSHHVLESSVSNSKEVCLDQTQTQLSWAQLKPPNFKSYQTCVLSVTDQWPLGWFCYWDAVEIQAKKRKKGSWRGKKRLQLSEIATVKKQRKTRLWVMRSRLPFDDHVTTHA